MELNTTSSRVKITVDGRHINNVIEATKTYVIADLEGNDPMYAVEIKIMGQGINTVKFTGEVEIWLKIDEYAR
jgi:hypothetical protein